MQKNNPAEITTVAADTWDELLKNVPIDIEASAKKLGAMTRKREIKNAADLLRIILTYSVMDWSFRLLGAWSLLTGIATISDVAIRNRIKGAKLWMQAIVGAYLSHKVKAQADKAVVLNLIDASVVNAPGSTGTDWRLHVKYDVAKGEITDVQVTDKYGGETLNRYTLKPNEINVVDSGYSHRPAIVAALNNHAQVVCRMNWKIIPLEQQDGSQFDLFTWLRTGFSTGAEQEVEVYLTLGTQRLKLRLLGCRLGAEAAERARRRTQYRARKKGKTLSQEALLACTFILILTNLPNEAWSIANILWIYRLRWQIEMLFKRLKSILDVDKLRCKDPEMAQTYLYGKLICVFICEGWTRILRHTYPDCFSDPKHPISLWRWLSLTVWTLRSLIVGHISVCALITNFSALRRFICDSPRKRLNQAATGVDWLSRLAVKPPMP